MKSWIKFGLVFLTFHIILSLVGLLFIYDSSVPNSDIGMLSLPNLFVSAVVFDMFPNIFGDWSIIYYGAMLWFFIGAIIGFVYSLIKK